MNKLKSNKGITLLDLILTIVAITLVIGIMTTVRSFFYTKVGKIQSAVKYAQEFDNFNAYFVKDVKQNENATIEQNGQNIKIILSPSGTIYNYKLRNDSENSLGDIYRESVKLASNVKSFDVTKNVIYVDGVRKILLTLDIKIGGKENTYFSKAIRYTFKYW